MKITTYKSNNSILNKYIEFYYESTLEDESYVAFPHYTLPTTISKDTTHKVYKGEVYLMYTNKKSNSFISYNRFKKPIEIIVEGKIYAFNIIFKPYGLAQFTNKQLNTHTDKTVKITSIFEDFFDLNPSFFELNIKEKIDTIDYYFLSKLEEKKDTNTVIKALSLMKNQELSITNIAKECACSTKKLSRLFHSLCGESPITYKRIISFRTALEKIKEISPEFNLSDIAIDTGYCDQAYFNNVFKKLTGEKPNDFFKKVTPISEENIYFQKTMSEKHN